MNERKYMDLLDEFYKLNTMLEVCRGYTQADAPDMKALESTLYSIECS